MKSIPKEQHAANIAAIDRLQAQVKPILSERMFNASEKHDIMLGAIGKLSGLEVSFACVKGENSWAMYFMYGHRSPEHIAIHGLKATVNQVNQLIQVEGNLIELYRR